MAKTISRKFLKSRTHVVIPGNLQLAQGAQVGGDLTIEGNAHVDGPLLCLGRLVVKGSLHAGDVFAGQGMDVSGDVSVGAGIEAIGGEGIRPSMEHTADAVASWSAFQFLGTVPFASRLDRIADAATLEALEHIDMYLGPAIRVGGDCVVAGKVSTTGDIEVGGHFNPDDCWVVSGCVHARTILVEGDLDAFGQVFARKWIHVEAGLSCTSLECMQLEVGAGATVEQDLVVNGRDTVGDDARYRAAEVGSDEATRLDRHASLLCDGDLKAGSITAGGSIEVDGSITSGRHIKANGSISCAGPLATPKGFGILAGLDLPRDRWLDAGYVCAPDKPQRLLTGVYRPLSPRRRGRIGLKPVRLK